MGETCFSDCLLTVDKGVEELRKGNAFFSKHLYTVYIKNCLNDFFSSESGRFLIHRCLLCEFEKLAYVINQEAQEFINTWSFEEWDTDFIITALGPNSHLLSAAIFLQIDECIQTPLSYFLSDVITAALT